MISFIYITCILKAFFDIQNGTIIFLFKNMKIIYKEKKTYVVSKQNIQNAINIYILKKKEVNATFYVCYKGIINMCCWVFWGVGVGKGV